jgi:uncharacterized membrane protein
VVGEIQVINFPCSTKPFTFAFLFNKPDLGMLLVASPKKAMATAAKKSVSKKSTSKRSTTKKAGTKRSAAKKPSAKRSTAKKASSKKGTTKKNKLGVKNALVNNINAHKKKGDSHSKKGSTVSKEAYEKMEQNWGRDKA